MAEQLHFHFSLSCIGEGNGTPLQRSCLENPRDGGAWWAAVYGVAQSETLAAAAGPGRGECLGQWAASHTMPLPAVLSKQCRTAGLMKAGCVPSEGSPAACGKGAGSCPTGVSVEWTLFGG